MEDETQETSTPAPSNSSLIKIIGIIIIVIIVAFAIWEFVLKGKSTLVPNSSMQSGSPSPSTAAAQETPATVSYKDGIYSATGHYVNPAGQETVDVTLTIKDGKVTGATFVGHPDNPTTVTMQNKFKAGFTQEVVGKPIDEINLTVVNGSSLTPKGFMDALTQIKAQAKA